MEVSESAWEVCPEIRRRGWDRALDGEPERRARCAGANGRLLLLTCDAVPPEGKGASHLRTMRPDGTGFRTILRFEAVGTYDNCTIDQATWSPNGKTVLYSTFRGIWTIRGADGKRKRSVLDVGSHAAWAPNGREVVFVQRVEESQADALFRVGRRRKRAAQDHDAGRERHLRSLVVARRAHHRVHGLRQRAGVDLDRGRQRVAPPEDRRKGAHARLVA